MNATATAKVYRHTSGFFLIWSKSVNHWYLAKALKSGVIKKHFVDGFSFKLDWKQAVAEIRKKGIKIPSPSQGWSRHKLQFENTVGGFDKELLNLHLELSK